MSKLALVSQLTWAYVWLAAGLCHAANFAGVILDNTGTAISGTTVTVARSSENGQLAAAEAYSITTAADGSFSVPGLSAGSFIVCVDGSALGLLDPCEWGSPTVVQVPTGTATVSTTTQLQQGASVSIRVNDPGLLLTAAAVAGQPHPYLAMGVWSADGYLHQARLTSSDATGHNFTLVVPPSVTLPFAVSALNLAVNDSNNSPVSASQRVNLNLAPGAMLLMNYTVSASAASASN